MTSLSGAVGAEGGTGACGMATDAVPSAAPGAVLLSDCRPIGVGEVIEGAAGAGMAGLVAAYELRRAGYTVKVLEYNHRAGGRSWTLRGGTREILRGIIARGLGLR